MRISSTYLPNVATSALLHLRAHLNEFFPFSKYSEILVDSALFKNTAV